MFQPKKIILLTLLILIFTGNFAQGLNDSEAMISPELQEKIEICDHKVEVLIYMAEQVDTGKVARETQINLSRNADQEYLKNKTKKMIHEKLQQTAQHSQASLLGFLKSKRQEGMVSEVRSYYIVNMVYASLSPQLVKEISKRSDVDYIYHNTAIERVEPGPDDTFWMHETGNHSWNHDNINAPEVWSEYKLDGSGVVVGIIDTGVNLKHKALEHNWRGYDEGHYDANYNWFDPVYNRPLPDDKDGHGTKVIGIVTGSELESDKQVGLAPGSSWIAARGFNDQGKTTKERLLITGQYMLAPTDVEGENPDPEMAPDIVINSWGADFGLDDWYRDLVENWRNAYIFPVFAAGNAGPAENTILNPANYPESFAVGAVNLENELADFSSRGPGAYGDIIKPNLVAPGKNIYTTVGNGYSYADGTSFAVPHVAGTAALMLSANSQLTVAEIEETLMNTATPLTDQDYPNSPNYGYGYGLLNAKAAVEKMWETMSVPCYDVSEDHIFYDYIKAIAAAGITKGDGEGNFLPSDKVTRGQMAAFLVRGIDGLDKKSPETPTFDDVSEDHTFYAYIEAIAAAGITIGDGEGNFLPSDKVSRGQVAAFMSRALGLRD